MVIIVYKLITIPTDVNLIKLIYKIGTFAMNFGTGTSDVESRAIPSKIKNKNVIHLELTKIISTFGISFIVLATRLVRYLFQF